MAGPDSEHPDARARRRAAGKRTEPAAGLADAPAVGKRRRGSPRNAAKDQQSSVGASSRSPAGTATSATAEDTVPEPLSPARPSGGAAQEARLGGAYRISRAALVLIALALGLGLLIGRASVKTDSSEPATVTATPTASATAAVAVSARSLKPTGSQCAVQHGTTLQLGVEVRNLSTSVVTLQSLRVGFPKGGLTLLSTSAGACGELSVPNLAEFGLPPQGTVWLTATAKVTTSCPDNSSVTMTVDATDPEGRVVHVPVAGFATLAGVTYSGCAK